MTAPTTLALEQAETALQDALRTGDVAALNDLLHADVVFVDSEGRELDKAADVATHTSGVLTLTDVAELHRTTRRYASAGTTRVQLHLCGIISGEPFDTDALYTRTWIHTSGRWQVVQAHSSTLTSHTEP